MTLFVLGVLVWYQYTGNSAVKEFHVTGAEESFEWHAPLEKCARAEIRLSGRLENDGYLTLRAAGTNVRTRRTFPISGERLGEEVLECPWNLPEMIVEFRCPEGVAGDLTIRVELFEKQESFNLQK